MRGAAVRATALLFSSDRLRIARMVRGLTLAEVAGKAGLSAAALSQFEKGKSRPTADSLSRISLALGFPLEYFGARPLPSADPEAAFFRSLASTRSRDRLMVGSKALLVADIVGCVEELVDLPQVRLSARPSTARRSIGEIEELARDLRREWQLDEGPVGNVTRLLESNGIVVVDSMPDPDKVDAFSRWVEERPIVVVFRKGTDTARLRFSALHEIGHLTMHDVSEAGIRAIENEANQFASEFLMPRAEIMQELPTRPDWSKLVQLKHRWGVSIQALLYRAKALGRMSDTVYRRAVTELNRRDWNKVEPAPLRDVEIPTLLPKCFELLEANGIQREVAIGEACLPDELLAQFMAVQRPALKLVR